MCDLGLTRHPYANGKVFKHYTTLGETATFSYNDFRRETAYIDERGLERRFFFDPNGNPLQVQEARVGRMSRRLFAGVIRRMPDAK